MCHSLLSDHNRRCEALGNGHYSQTACQRWRVTRPSQVRRPCAGRWRPAAPRCPGPPGWPAVSTGQPRDGRGRRLVKAWRRQAPSRAAYSVGPSVTQAAAWERACVMAPHCVLAVLCPFAASSCGGRPAGQAGCVAAHPQGPGSSALGPCRPGRRQRCAASDQPLRKAPHPPQARIIFEVYASSAPVLQVSAHRSGGRTARRLRASAQQRRRAAPPGTPPPEPPPPPAYSRLAHSVSGASWWCRRGADTAASTSSPWPSSLHSAEREASASRGAVGSTCLLARPYQSSRSTRPTTSSHAPDHRL